MFLILVVLVVLSARLRFYIAAATALLTFVMAFAFLAAQLAVSGPAGRYFVAPVILLGFTISLLWGSWLPRPSAETPRASLPRRPSWLVF